MAKDERRQQDELRQILYEEAAHPVPPVGRPRARGVQPPPQAAQPPYQRPAPPPRQQPHQGPPQGQQARPAPPPVPQGQGQRGRVRGFEQAPYSGAAPRARTATSQPAPKGGGAVTWLLLLLVLLLLAAAGFLVFTLFNGGLGGLSLGGKANTRALPSGGGLLTQTADAGDAYVAQTIFIGDSNFERMREFSLVDASTVAAKVGIGIASVTGEPFIEVTGKDEPLTISQTMAAVGPRRMLVMLGTNDVPNMSAEDFAKNYQAVLEDLRKSAPNGDIVVSAIPPVASWKDSEMLNASAVRQFNQALLALCEAEDYPYLDTYAALADDSGYLPEAYTDDGYHLTQEALQKVLEYYRTHAYNP